MHPVKTLAVPSLIVALTILAISGACSMHDPGPYEGGGRSTTVPFPENTTTEDSGTTQDNFVPPDNFVGPETGGNS